MTGRAEERSAVGKGLTAGFVWYDKHPFFYSALIGVVGNICFGDHIDPVKAAGIFAALGGGLWYVCKAFLISGQTAARMKANGEPLFKAGGLTEYDSEMASCIAREIVKEQRRSD